MHHVEGDSFCKMVHYTDYTRKNVSIRCLGKDKKKLVFFTTKTEAGGGEGQANY